jgi:fructose-1,6-bisphosphatase/sedoheptulose 1,7-bisphosphatase-like protein
MAEPARPSMTVADILAWDDGTDTRPELVEGVIDAMAPGSEPHGVIAATAIQVAGDRMRRRPLCRVRSEAAIRVDDRDERVAGSRRMILP